MAYENPRKIAIARKLIEQHPNDQILIIGQYLTQLHNFAMEIDAPLITGQTPNKTRDELYDQFRRGEIKVLILSRVGNFAIDLPDASVAIQISGCLLARARKKPNAWDVFLGPRNKESRPRFIPSLRVKVKNWISP